MSEQPTPSDSSNLDFIFRSRMTAMNPVEPSEPVASAEQGTEEVVEIESDAKEVFSTSVTMKGKEKVEGSRKPPKPAKWAGGKPHTSPRNVKSPRVMPQTHVA